VKAQLWLASVIAAYSLLFTLQESAVRHVQATLAPTLPAAMQQATLGYLRQLGAAMLYIKSAVFLGGVEPGVDRPGYMSTLADHFDAASSLHPKLLDIYFLAESSLSWINRDGARRANVVLERGMEARADQWVIPFFAGFNSFHYLWQHDQASRYLQRAAAVDGAPRWVGHLASIVAGRGGDIRGGLLWLKAMLADEEDEAVRARYEQDLAVFEKAWSVQKALEEYEQEHGV